MSLIEDVVEDAAMPIIIGAGILIAAPILFPALAGGLRPVAKKAVRGFMQLKERAKEATAEAREQWSDLVAEAQAEPGTPAQAPEQPAPEQPQQQPAAS